MHWPGPPGFTCFISLAPVVQFYLLLSPYLRFIFFVYLDFLCSRGCCIDKLGVFHADQTSMCFDPHLN